MCYFQKLGITPKPKAFKEVEKLVIEKQEPNNTTREIGLLSSS